MKLGDLVMTSKVEARTEPGPRPRMRSTWKANRGCAFLLLNFGTVQSCDEVEERVKKVMTALGWVAADDAEGLRAALADLEKPAESVEAAHG